ncbi:MAG TPA: murein L,D-transpeptidase catalytic domain family protein [Flavisolibacter sp.]|nr:murein L,D-transpeptidase catalytic domain family protein [Flavisolibacter sp.]
MRKYYLPLSIFCLFACFTIFSAFKTKNSKTLIAAATTIISSKNHAARFSSEIDSLSNKLYDTLKLEKLGLTKEALLYAYKGQHHLIEEGIVSNSSILTVCDFSQSSKQKRMYIIDTKNLKVLLNTYVAHGRNSGLDYAERFSNAPESLESSLGFYITRNTYFGKHGLSLKLSGVDQGFNDNAESRDVVVHGAQYIGNERSGAGFMGRSYGCPAVPQRLAPKVIDLIKNGTCLFIYHPDQNYFLGSTILNG